MGLEPKPDVPTHLPLSYTHAAPFGAHLDSPTLGYYKPPHKPTEAFYDPSFWSEATGLPPPEAGKAKNATPA
jgi:hypothetical protein